MQQRLTEERIKDFTECLVINGEFFIFERSLIHINGRIAIFQRRKRKQEGFRFVTIQACRVDAIRYCINLTGGKENDPHLMRKFPFLGFLS
jgi:hypothetical protein